MRSMQAVLKKGGGNESFHDVALRSIIGDSNEPIPKSGQHCVVWEDILHVYLRESTGMVDEGKLVVLSWDGEKKERWTHWRDYSMKGN